MISVALTALLLFQIIGALSPEPDDRILSPQFLEQSNEPDPENPGEWPKPPSDFDSWVKFYGKQYKDKAEYTYRQKVFKENLARFDELNRKNIEEGGKAAFGATEYADLTVKEFRILVAGSDTLDMSTIEGIPEREKVEPKDPPVPNFFKEPKKYDEKTRSFLQENTQISSQNHHTSSSPRFMELNTSVQAGSPNWYPWLTDVKDQRPCGSCWAFAATEAIESFQALYKHGYVLDLSTQQAASCSKSNPCGGGQERYVYEYTKKKALGWASFNPYNAFTVGSGCDTITYYPPASYIIKDYEFYKSFPGFGSLNLASDLYRGPVTSWIRSDFLQGYTGGVVYGGACTGPVNHAVQAVKWWGSSKYNAYFMLRNSWGKGKPHGGYFYVKGNWLTDSCGLGYVVSYPIF